MTNKLTNRQKKLRNKARSNDKIRRIKNKKSKYMIYYIFFSIVFLSLTITLSLTTFFKIENIQIEIKCNNLNKAQILKTINLNYGDNLIMFNSKKAIEKLLNTYKNLSETKIEKQFPDTLKLVCDFNSPLFFIETPNNEMIGIANSGRAVKFYKKINTTPTKLTIKFNTKTFNPPQLGDFLNLPPAEFQELNTIVKEATLANLNNITKIEITPNIETTINYDNRIDIKLKNGSRTEQILKSASKIISDYVGQNEAGTICYVENNKTIHFIQEQNLFKN